MKEREYTGAMLFIGVLSVKGFPEDLREKLESRFGPIRDVSDPIPFSFTDYYVPEMGEGIERFFISFSRLVSPATLAEAKVFTNRLEMEYAAPGGMRKINLDPGTLSEANIVLATTKNRSHRIAIGSNLYAELTLMYQNKAWQSFPWTYADYRSSAVQETLNSFRKDYLAIRKEELKKG